MVGFPRYGHIFVVYVVHVILLVKSVGESHGVHLSPGRVGRSNDNYTAMYITMYVKICDFIIVWVWFVVHWIHHIQLPLTPCHNVWTQPLWNGHTFVKYHKFKVWFVVHWICRI